ncbi:MAG: metallophosphatase [Bacteroidota bacterium]|nr:metallophosphatase [Bacteroidota bacterium]
MGGFIMSNRRTFLKQSVIGGGALAFGLFPSELFASGELVKLTVMHTNDLHCHLDPFPEDHTEFPGKGGMTRIASMINQARKENPNLLLLDAGDMFQGTPYFNYFKGDLILKVMSKMGYNAGTIGNHEFDNGLNDILSAFKFANFPIISSNYNFSDTILADMVAPYHILKKGGVKIGIYGLGIELAGLVGKLNYGNTQYLDPLEMALKMELILKKEHSCDLVICLSHLGYSYEHDKISDLTLAPLTSYTDLIAGGHTHTFLEKPVVLKNAAGKPIIVNQAGWAALALGKIEFIFDRSGKLKEPVVITGNL